MTWELDTGLDVTSAFIGITTPVRDLYDDIHRRGWTVKKVDIKDGQYQATGENPYGESLDANGNTEATAVGNLLITIMRHEHVRSAAQQKVGMWQTSFEDQLEPIAQAYAEAAIYDPAAASAWHELAQDSMRRAETLQQHLKVEIVDDPHPYKTANELREDVKEKQHVFVTRAQAHHPIWTRDQMVAYRLVHDVLGHCVGGGDWGWHGENLACAAHFPLLSESAQKALFTEALGQAAFGQVYQQWGPQKVAFLDKLLEKAQEDENGPGHYPVHPSQSVPPTAIPDVRKEGSVTDPVDPNAGWKSGVQPLPDNAYLWQGDPLDSQGVMENARSLEPGLANMPDPLAKQSVVNAFRGALLGPRKNLMNNAVHYQHVMGIPADVDDPMAYYDALEQQREIHNQSQGHAPNSHIPFWPELQGFRRWVRSSQPDMDPAEVDRVARREMMHMLSEEEERVVSEDEPGTLTAEAVEREAFMNLKKRLRTMTKPRVDDKHDFGETALFRSAGDVSGMYGSYLASHLRPVAGVSKHSDELTKAALEDLREHGGSGHHFRANTLNLGIPGVGPKEASLAWLHLAPQRSQLGVIDPHISEALGHDYTDDNNPRDYFKHERELTAGRDAAGYSHLPLGPFTWGLWDHKTGGPGFHQDHSALKVHSPTPHYQIDWASKMVPDQAGQWQPPYWWDSTQQARDGVADSFDKFIGVNYPKTQVPFQPRTSTTARTPYFVHPETGEEVVGQPGMSLMQHIKQSLGVNDVASVWQQELQAGKR